ncbi:clathrin interactor EPSIN 1 isoform X2 [Selaginella moellendorffii]|uniref:clathrin interactor EPSIN 1 isoform X2 n=1 Tax=Selaginella moellendorffii TaxID=88036 RepID=UPI000D1C7DDF|nr:clathrin interactor EPSIN 1 isoform X2 [Selaginella moellendorffii]|eukprot:XP_024531847.1 clathrin interactor EPSIN 1 isoform X2 [Selaginella moellendorffii]
MDLKKALDKTVRNMKREVNKKVLKVPEIERKVLEATCNEPWGPHGTLMADIAQATRNFNEYQMIMTILWKRLNDRGRNWRHVLKSLTVMEFLVGHGAERFIDELREHTYQIQTLVDFQYVDSSGRDQGLTVRRKAQALVSLINDKEKIREFRQKAAANRDKYRGVSSVGGIYRSSSYSSTGGTYSDRDDDDRYGGGRYSGDRYRDGDRYDDRYRDGDRYRDDDRYGRDSDRPYSDKYDGTDRDRGYEDASSGSKDDDDWKSERKQSRGRSNPPSYEEVSSPANGSQSKGNDTVAPLESHAKKEEELREETKTESSPVDEFDPRGSIPGSSSDQDLFGHEPKLTSAGTAPPTFLSAVEELFAPTSAPSASSTDLDPSNPFGTPEFHANAPDGATNGVANSFEDSLALALVPQSQYEQESQPELPSQLSSDNPFQAQNSQSPPQQLPQQQQEQSLPQQQFHAQQQFPPQQLQQQLPSQQQFLPQQLQQQLPSQQQFPPQQLQPQQQFPPQQLPSQQQFPPQQLPPQEQFPPQQLPSQQQFPPQQLPPQEQFPPQQQMPPFRPQQQQQFPPQQQFPFQQQQFPQQQQPAFQQQAQSFVPQPPTFRPPHFAQAGFPQQQQPQSFLQQQQQTPTYSQPFAPQQQQQQQQSSVQDTTLHAKPKQQEPFQPKSAVWADTLSSGLVNLNIGPLKSDPLAELGIHLTESKVSASRREEKKTSSVPATKGQAMGSGSGLGLAGASIMHRAPPPPPPIMGGQMGMGMGMGMGMVPPPPMGMHPSMMPMAPPMMNGMGMGMYNPSQQQGGFR